MSALAVWRVAKVITEEEGPFSIFTKIRSHARVDGKYGWIGRGVYCLWCVSFWIGLFTGLALAPVLIGILYGLAMSALAILFDTILESILKLARKP